MQLKKSSAISNAAGTVSVPSNVGSANDAIAGQGSGKKLFGILATLLLVAGGVVAFVYLKPPADTVQQTKKGDANTDGTGKQGKITGASKGSGLPQSPKSPAKKGGELPPKQKSNNTPKSFPNEPSKPFPSDPAVKPPPQGKKKNLESEKKDGPNEPKKVEPDPVKPNPEKPIPKIPVKPNPPVEVSRAEKVNAAIDRGVAFLKKSQLASGTWMPYMQSDSNHLVGYASLGGLTLLECGVGPDDVAIQRAAGYVRKNCVKSSATYNISTAILFLDRLGDPRDRPLIQSLALRIMAGQKMWGNWGYTCPMLSSLQLENGYTVMLRFRRSSKNLEDPFAGINASGTNKKPTEAMAVWEKLKNFPYPNLPQSHVISYTTSRKLAAAYFNPSANAESLPEWGNKAIPNVRATLATIQQSTRTTRPNLLRRLISNPEFGVEPATRDTSDNSNSQFAMLGLWAARRHGVPTEHALRLAAIHYCAYQNADGGWAYHDGAPTSGPMTGVGLLGLALGYGVSDPAEDKDKKGTVINKAQIEDTSIQFGLQKFTKLIRSGGDGGEIDSASGRNLYFLWTVERVAVLYDLKTFGSHDWYQWGLDILLPGQSKKEGSWNLQGYTGSSAPIDTCFALLFLKRSNLVRDLTQNLRFFLAIDGAKKKRTER